MATTSNIENSKAQDLKLAAAEAELQLNDYSNCNCDDNSPASTINCQTGLLPELISGNDERDVSYEEADEAAHESFGAGFLLDNSPCSCCPATGQSSMCSTPVRLHLLPPMMHSTPVSSKQLAFSESFQFEERNTSSKSDLPTAVHPEPVLLHSSDISYFDSTCENTDNTILQLGDLSCSASLIGFPDGPEAESSNGSSSALIVIEQPDTDSNCSTRIFASIDNEIQYETHPKKRRTENGEHKSPLVTNEECCSHCCLSHLSASEINSTLEYFRSKNTIEQNQFLLDSFRVISNQDVTNHMICGKSVCKTAYTKILEISKKRYNKIQKIFNTNPTVKLLRKPIVRSLSTKAIEAKTWMTRYFNRIGDSMPHMDQVHLPHGLTKQDIYHTMKSQLQEQGLTTVISLSHFYLIWDNSFKKVVIPKHSLFSKCDICTKYNKERLLLSKDQLQNLKKKYEMHLKNVEQERSKYHHHREKSRSQPRKYLTIIIDGMDQNKTNVPSIFPTPKAIQSTFRLQTHCTGVLAHTRAPRGKKVYAMYDICQWPQDTNITIHALIHTLLDFTEHLPEVLYLQLDNAGNQNKNRYLLGFCALLVEKKIFKKININFLPVGHTHEDVDQFFSRIALQLRKKGAGSIPDLLEATKASMDPTPTTTLIEHMFNVKKWILPHLNDLHGHRDPHCFKFVCNEHNKCLMFFRNWTCDPWCPEDKATVVLKSVPTDLPEFTVPIMDKVEPDKLQDSIPRFKPWISSTAWCYWEEFLHTTLSKLAITPDDESLIGWPLMALEAASCRRMDGVSTDNQENNSEGAQVLEQMLDEERVAVEVYTGAYRNPHHTVREVLNVDTLEGIKVGHLVALNVENCALRPLIAKILSFCDNELEIVWLEGSYTAPWKIAKKRDGRTLLDWTDRVPKQSVILFDFELTKSNRLRKATVEHLKAAYSLLNV